MDETQQQKPAESPAQVAHEIRLALLGALRVAVLGSSATCSEDLLKLVREGTELLNGLMPPS